MRYKINPFLFAGFILTAGFMLVGGSFSSGFAQTAVAGKTGTKKVIYIKLKLDSAAGFEVSTAALKYNKQLAFSFTLDDGYRSAYLTAFPLLNGGKVSPPSPDEWHNDQGGDGSTAEGLFFSDGCGKKVAFKLGLAINAAGLTEHPANRGHLSWPEVKEMYDAGWDILNHGYHHATKHGTDFYTEVVENVKAVQQNLGFTMSQFVVPGGESDPGYEHEYEKNALNTGTFAVASYKGAGPVIPVDRPVDLQSMIYARSFLSNTGDTVNLSIADRHLKTIDSLMKQSVPVWFNEFTHGVGDSNLWKLSMFFPEFKYYMTAIANQYGVKGTDRIWMAPWQEVYEYIWLRDRIQVSSVQKGREVTIKLVLPEIPDTFRNSVISLKVKTPAGFTVSSSPGLKVWGNGKKEHDLLNIDLKKPVTQTWKKD